MKTKHSRTPPRLIWLVRVPLIVALLTTLFLMVGSPSMVDECCGSLIKGKWASVFGFPVSAIASVLYTLALITTLPEIRQNRLSRTFLLFSAAAILGSAIWFTALQFYNKEFCPFCTAIHTAGVVFASALFINRRRLVSRVNVVQTTLVGFVAVVALALAQSYGPGDDALDITGSPASAQPATLEKTTTTSPPDEGGEAGEAGDKEKPKPVPIPNFNPDVASIKDPTSPEPAATPPLVSGPGVHFGGQIIINPSAVPYVGSTSATHTITKFFDYTCASCRDSHGDLEKLLQMYPGKFRILLVPCPLNSRCNAFVSSYVSSKHPGACELAKLSLALWYSAPEKFVGFHDFLMSERLPVDVARARREAERLADPSKLSSKETTDWVEAQLEATFANYALLRQTNIKFPKLLLDREAILHGTPRTTEIFLQAMAEQFALPYPPPSK